VGATATQIPGIVLGAMVGSEGILWMFYALFALALITGVALIMKWRVGYYLLYTATLLSFVGPRLSFIPFITRFLPRGPELDYYVVALNICVASVTAFCHWSVARDEEPTVRKLDQGIAIAFVVLLIPGLIFWKSGIRTGNGEVARVAEVPFIGAHLAPLESTQPVLFRSIELLRQGSGTVVFRGSSSEKNIKEFAAAHDLKLMTNAAARAKFLPIVKSWKLDPERFPVFNTPDDLCYIGRVPKGSKQVLQICHRPSDGRFTAMAMGSPATKK
jgi:hypothetical protein